MIIRQETENSTMTKDHNLQDLQSDVLHYRGPILPQVAWAHQANAEIHSRESRQDRSLVIRAI